MHIIVMTAKLSQEKLDDTFTSHDKNNYHCIFFYYVEIYTKSVYCTFK